MERARSDADAPLRAEMVAEPLAFHWRFAGRDEGIPLAQIAVLISEVGTQRCIHVSIDT
jgi:hypothetical protein